MAPSLRILLLVAMAGVVMAQTNVLTDEEEAARIAAENADAHYQFSSDVDDRISDLTQHRDETRDGLNVKGSYSYSDGFQKRTVHYVADMLGFRVEKEKVETLMTGGPKVNPNGVASVRATLQDGAQIDYRIQSVPDDA